MTPSPPFAGRSYTNQPGVGLYPTTGTQSDYAYSRHIANSSLRKTYGYTFETGPFTGKCRVVLPAGRPDADQAGRQVGHDRLDAAVHLCHRTHRQPGLQRRHGGAALRRVRDELLATTDAGREWIALFERVQAPLLRAVMADERLAREAGELLAVTGELLADNHRVIDGDTVARAATALRTLDESMPEERAELRAVLARLETATNRRATEVIDTLLAHGPDNPP